MSLEGKTSPGQELKGRINAVDILTISAYGIAVKHGFEGTEEEWLASLQCVGATPDWNAIEGELGYVLNRTHWKEFTPEEYLERERLTFLEDVSSVLDASGIYQRIGEWTGYRVTWDGVVYDRPCVKIGEKFYIGNVNFALPDEADTGEPFCIVTNGTMSAAVCAVDKVAGQVEVHTYKLEVGDYTYHKLPKEYLPDDIGCGAANAVTYTEQTLTDAQKAQARQNISAASVEDVDAIGRTATAASQAAAEAKSTASAASTAAGEAKSTAAAANQAAGEAKTAAEAANKTAGEAASTANVASQTAGEAKTAAAAASETASEAKSVAAEAKAAASATNITEFMSLTDDQRTAARVNISAVGYEANQGLNDFARYNARTNIKAVSYEQAPQTSLTTAEKAQARANIDAVGTAQLTEAVNNALAQAKESGDFNGKNGDPGTSVTVSNVSESSASGGTNTVTFSDGKKLNVMNGKDGSPGKTPTKGVDFWTAADQESIVQDVIRALGTPVFGRVDGNNNIILTGELADGTYTIKYEDADGTVTEIGTLNNVPAPTYTNVLPLAIDKTGAVYNGTGYKVGARIGSSGTEGTVSNTSATNPIFLTGYILAPAGATICMKNCFIDTNGVNGAINNTADAAYYGHDLAGLYGCITYNDLGQTNFNAGTTGYSWKDFASFSLATPKPTVDGNGYVTEFTLNTTKTQYIRMHLGGDPTTAIITVNEPITD